VALNCDRSNLIMEFTYKGKDYFVDDNYDLFMYKNEEWKLLGNVKL
jgi:hypothetical protein